MNTFRDSSAFQTLYLTFFVDGGWTHACFRKPRIRILSFIEKHFSNRSERLEDETGWFNLHRKRVILHTRLLFSDKRVACFETVVVVTLSCKQRVRNAGARQTGFLTCTQHALNRCLTLFFFIVISCRVLDWDSLVFRFTYTRRNAVQLRAFRSTRKAILTGRRLKEYNLFEKRKKLKNSHGRRTITSRAQRPSKVRSWFNGVRKTIFIHFIHFCSEPNNTWFSSTN